MIAFWLTMEGERVLSATLANTEVHWQPIGLPQSTQEVLRDKVQSIWDEICGDCQPPSVGTVLTAVELLAVDLDLELEMSPGAEVALVGNSGQTGAR